MTGLRINPILAISIAALLGVLFLGTLLLWQGRDGEMRDAEADFRTKMRSEMSRSNSTAAAWSDDAPTDEPDTTGTPAEDELAAWYAESSSGTASAEAPESPAEP